MPDPIAKEDIDRLRQELNSLKPMDEQPQSLQESIKRLQATLDKLLALFESADKEIYAEYHAGLHDNGEQINKLIDQNEKIARGMVALADMFNAMKVTAQQAPAEDMFKPVKAAPPALAQPEPLPAMRPALPQASDELFKATKVMEPQPQMQDNLRPIKAPPPPLPQTERPRLMRPNVPPIPMPPAIQSQASGGAPAVPRLGALSEQPLAFATSVNQNSQSMPSPPSPPEQRRKSMVEKFSFR